MNPRDRKFSDENASIRRQNQEKKEEEERLKQLRKVENKEVNQKLLIKKEIQVELAKGKKLQEIKTFIKEKHQSIPDDLIESMIIMRINMQEQEREEEREKKIKEWEEQLERANKLDTTGKTEEQKERLKTVKEKITAKIAVLKKGHIKYKLKF